MIVYAIVSIPTEYYCCKAAPVPYIIQELHLDNTTAMKRMRVLKKLYLAQLKEANRIWSTYELDTDDGDGDSYLEILKSRDDAFDHNANLMGTSAELSNEIQVIALEVK